MSTVTWTVWIAEVLALVVLTGGFAYPAVAHSQNVLYRDGVLGLAAALGCLTAGSVCELLVDLTAAGAYVEVVAYVWYAASSVVAAAAMWWFAREFVDLDSTEDVEVEPDEFTGGFEREP